MGEKANSQVVIETVAGLRGGITGAAPFGDPTVKIGCTVSRGDEKYNLDLTLDAGPAPEVIDERLVRRDARGRVRELLHGQRQESGSGILDVDVYSGGAPRRYTMLSARPATVQAASRIPMDSAARRSVVQACTYITAALQGVFVHDPVPGRMREYSQIGSSPDRWGTTMSAVVYELMKQPDTRERLLALVRGLVDAEVADLKFAEARVDDRPVDVMVAVQERAQAGDFLAQARVMSDGTLRYLAIVSTLLHLARRPAEPTTTNLAGWTLVVEEIENGLFPTQASRILDLLREEATRRETRLLTTTHSPALLDALRPEDHDGVVICGRDAQGRTTLRRLVDHDRYVEVAGGGAIGTAITRGTLSRPTGQASSFSALFAS
jgi:hypothetical protein